VARRAWAPNPQIRKAAQRAATILRTWHSQQAPRPEQQQLGLGLPETVS
jgi:hypothetical protein